MAVSAPISNAHDLPLRANQYKPLRAHNPAAIALTFARHVPLAATFTAWVQKLYAECVACSKYSRLRHKTFGQVLVLVPQMEKARLFRLLGKQGLEFLPRSLVERPPALAA